MGILYGNQFYLSCWWRLIPALDTIAASLWPLCDDWRPLITDLQRALDMHEPYLFVVARCLNPILHTVWLDGHAMTLKNCTAKYFEVRKI
jgi:hypothetical protein